MLKASRTHLCDNQDMMRKLGIEPDLGESRMSLVTDLTCKENKVHMFLKCGQIMTYPVTVATSGPYASCHHILRVFDVTDKGEMGQLIGYVRIDWDEDVIYFSRRWADTELSYKLADGRIVAGMKRVFTFLLEMSQSESSFDDMPYDDLNVRMSRV
jgi:hypothetical protein